MTQRQRPKRHATQHIHKARHTAWPISLFWSFLFFCLLPLPLSHAEWNVRRTDRWRKIADRLFSLYTAQPKEGYALRRLLVHYRRKGGPNAILKRIYQRQQTQPKNWRLQLATALVHLYIGKYKQALASLHDLQRKLPPKTTKTIDFDWYLARAHFREQNWKQARFHYNKLRKRAKTKARRRKIYLALIQLDTKRGKWNTAIKWYQGYLKLQPRDVSMWLGLARTHARREQWKPAIAALKKALRYATQRRKPQLWSRLIRYYLTTKQYDKALDAIAKTRRLLVSTHWMQSTLLALEQETHRNRGTLPQLIKEYAKRAKKRPKQYLPLQAQLLAEQKQTTQAIAIYRTLFKRYPTHPAFPTAIRILREQRKYPLAIQWLRRRLTHLKDDETSAILLVTILHQTRDIKARNNTVKTLVKQFAKDDIFLGKLARTMEPWKQALSLRNMIYATLCQRQPQRASCFRKWGELLWAHRNKHRAWTVWNRIKRIKPPQADNWFTLAQIYTQHGKPRQSIPLLKQVLHTAPKHVKGHLLLARMYTRINQPRQAFSTYRKLILLTRSLTIRSQARNEMLFAMHKLYHPQTIALRLKRNALLHPFEAEPQKQLLTFHFRRKTRVLLPNRTNGNWRFRHRRRRYRRGRWRRRHRRGRYYRYFRRGRAYFRRRNQRYVYRVSPPTWIRQLLQRSLKQFAGDPEFHLLALTLHQDQMKAWPHLTYLLRNEPTRTTQYLKQLQQLANRHDKANDLLNVIKTLCERRPGQAIYWGTLGKLALRHNQPQLGCKAYQRATSIAPKDLRFRLGTANCLGAQKQWRKAYQTLLTLPHPHKTPLRQQWLKRLTIYGLRTGTPLSQLLLTFRRTLSQPQRSIMHVLYELLQQPEAMHAPKTYKELQKLVREGWPFWKFVLQYERSVKDKARALYFLHFAPKAVLFPLLEQATKSPHPPVRAGALLSIALHNHKQLFYLIEKYEQTSRHYTVKRAAKLAAHIMTQPFSMRAHYYAFSSPSIRPWSILALQSQGQHITYGQMKELARLYGYADRAQRYQIMRIVDQLTVNAIVWLGKARTHTQHRCFAFDAIKHLKRKQAPSHLRPTAEVYRVYPAIYKQHCRHTIYGPR